MKLPALCLMIVAALAVVPAANGQQVVAKIKVHNPSDAIADVVIRGTLPLPADYDKPVSGLVLSDGGQKLVTQASVFSTYPGSSDDYPVGRPEVVQLAAKAALPASSFKEFDVIEVGANSPIKGASPGPAMTKLLGAKSPVVVEATDVYGNRYRADALAEADTLEVRQSGPVLEERIYQTILTPVGEVVEDKPAIKTLLRIRAYLTTFAEEDFATLSLMIYNGSIDDYSGPIYYRSIRVGVAESVDVHIWRKDFSPAATGDVTEANGYGWVDCPPARADGKVFVMPYGSAAVLRTTLYAAPAKERAIQYADNTPVFVPVPSLKLWSWSNFATARYGASKYPMPLDLGPDGLAETAKLADDRLTSPTLGWDLVYLRYNPIAGARTLGHAMPAGVEYGGMTGGQGVGYVFGVRAAVTGHNGRIQEHILMADRNWDRQRAHLFHDDGKPFMYNRYVVDEDGKKLFDWPYDSRGFEKPDIKDPANVTIRNPSDKAFGGKYWFTTGWEEGAIMADGARAVVAMLSSPNDAEHAQTMKDIYRRVGKWIATQAWNEDIHSPPFHIGLKYKETGKFLDKPVGDSPCDFYLGSPLAWYYELTGDKLFLDRLNEMSGDQGLAGRSRQQLRSWSYSLWLAQRGDKED